MPGTYTVEYISTGGVFTDISNFIHSLDKTTFYSDGRISTSSLILQANFGQFITDSRSGSTPIISQYDRLRLTYLDSDGLAYHHLFEVINELGGRIFVESVVDEGTTFTIKLPL